MRQTKELVEKFKEFGVKESNPTFILSECLLVYMANDEAKRILKGINDHFSNDVIILNYEMIHPNDAFGQKMIENLEDRGCMIPGFTEVPDE